MRRMNDNLRRALDALEAGAADLRTHAPLPAARLRARLRTTAEEILSHLEADERATDGDPEDIVSRLDRQAQSIAEDLRRADDLMKRRLRGE